MSSFDSDVPSTKPYLIRALYDWCMDGGFTPYLAVRVDASVRVPKEFVKNGEIVLNVGAEATQALHLGNDFIEFKARFGGVAREIVVPVSHVLAIYARENGQGMAFPPPAAPVLQALKTHGAEREQAGLPVDEGASPDEGTLQAATDSGSGADTPGRPGGRPQLTRIK
ncbi:MAG: hypothetical protein RLZZ352_650 [Pseudomonadota bacterium]|jgi:stringent starvation protein B